MANHFLSNTILTKNIDNFRLDNLYDDENDFCIDFKQFYGKDFFFKTSTHIFSKSSKCRYLVLKNRDRINDKIKQQINFTSFFWDRFWVNLFKQFYKIFHWDAVINSTRRRLSRIEIFFVIPQLLNCVTENVFVNFLETATVSLKCITTLSVWVNPNALQVFLGSVLDSSF
jgi:hypothetical protein